MQFLYRILYNLPWPLSRWAPSIMEFPDGTFVRAYKTTPVQRYVGALLTSLAETPPHHLTLHSNTPLPIFPGFPTPPPFPKVIKELKRISQFNHSNDQGIYTGQTWMSTRLPSTNETADLTLDVRISSQNQITTIQIQLTLACLPPDPVPDSTSSFHNPPSR